MSSNIYEDPLLTTNVRYNKGGKEDGAERVERMVAIYESADALEDRRVDPSTQDGGVHTQKHLPAVKRNPSRAAVLVLGLLCVLLLVGLTVLSKLYFSVTLEKYQLTERYEELEISYDNLDNGYCQLQKTESRTQGSITRWNRFQCSCYYKQSEMKNWADSRTDCQSIGADLVIITSKEEHEFVSKLNKDGESWIGLQSVKSDEWKDRSKSGWKWVDQSEPTYLAWKVGVNVQPVDGSSGYIDPQGQWKHTNNGSKQWICEREM